MATGLVDAGMQVNSAADLASVGDSPVESTPVSAPETSAPSGTEIDTAEPVSPDAEGLDDLNDPGDATGAEEQEADAAGEVPEEAAQPEQTEQAEDLPEGVVKGKDRNGKQGLFVTPERWQSIYGNHQAVQQMSELAGEPIDVDGFGVRERAFQAQVRFADDLVSGDPNAQGNVIKFMLDRARDAQQKGMVAGNPLVPFTQTLYKELKAADPDAYAALRSDASKDLIQELYDAAAQSKNKYLYLAMGHVADALGLPYKPEAEMEGFFAQGGQQSEVAQLRARLQEVEGQLNGRSAQTQAAQFQSWQGETRQAVYDSMMSDAILPAVASAQNQGLWAKNPQAFQEYVVKPLHSAVNDILAKDKAFGDKITRLTALAQTGTAQRRAEVQGELVRLYANRASLAAQAKSGEILRTAAKQWETANQQTHARRQAGAAHRAPQSGGSPVRRSLVPTQAAQFEVASPDALRRDLDGLFR